MTRILHAPMPHVQGVVSVTTHKKALRLLGKGSALEPSMRPESPSQLSDADQKLLRGYLSSIQAKFERSVFGSTLDRVAEDAILSKPCPRCAGPKAKFPGIVLVPRTRQNPITGAKEIYEFGAECPVCKGTAVVPGRTKSRRRAPRSGQRWCHKCHGAAGNKDCTKCHGDGYVTAQVCFETGEPGASNRGYLPDHDSLVQFGIASRRLAQVNQRSPMAYQALMLYFGDEGAKWARTKHGAILVLCHLTKPGKRLIRLAATKDSELDQIEQLGVIADVNAVQPKETESQLLSLAKQAAMALFRSACEVWNSTAQKD